MSRLGLGERMTGERIEPLEPPYEPAVQEVFEKLGALAAEPREPIALFRIVARNAPLLEPFPTTPGIGR